ARGDRGSNGTGGRPQELRAARRAAYRHRRPARRDERRVRCLPRGSESCHLSTRYSVNAATTSKLRGRAFRVEWDQARFMCAMRLLSALHVVVDHDPPLSLSGRLGELRRSPERSWIEALRMQIQHAVVEITCIASGRREPFNVFD